LYVPFAIAVVIKKWPTFIIMPSHGMKGYWIILKQAVDNYPAHNDSRCNGYPMQFATSAIE
jgi:hypothetical protein